mmetsp:Transcript_27081/g.59177  ORF Transcript_27081/g.59177 Transcript_27081/m.59177 type:complete len:884 (-) Transcript_27081:1518-4169(-)
MPATEQENMSAIKTGAWNDAEDKLLSHWQSKVGNKWSIVAKHIPGRTGQQCAQRWRHKVNPNIVREAWSKEEDALLQHLVHTIGHHWAEIARHFKGRTDQQCMGRWRRHLDPSIRKDSWTLEEDSRLLSLYQQHGNSWSTIAKLLTGRTPQQCRGRWCQLTKPEMTHSGSQGKSLEATSSGEEQEVNAGKAPLQAKSGRTFAAPCKKADGHVSNGQQPSSSGGTSQLSGSDSQTSEHTATSSAPSEGLTDDSDSAVEFTPAVDKQNGASSGRKKGFFVCGRRSISFSTRPRTTRYKARCGCLHYPRRTPEPQHPGAGQQGLQTVPEYLPAAALTHGQASAIRPSSGPSSLRRFRSTGDVSEAYDAAQVSLTRTHSAPVHSIIPLGALPSYHLASQLNQRNQQQLEFVQRTPVRGASAVSCGTEDADVLELAGAALVALSSGKAKRKAAEGTSLAGCTSLQLHEGLGESLVERGLLDDVSMPAGLFSPAGLSVPSITNSLNQTPASMSSPASWILSPSAKFLGLLRSPKPQESLAACQTPQAALADVPATNVRPLAGLNLPGNAAGVSSLMNPMSAATGTPSQVISEWSDVPALSWSSWQALGNGFGMLPAGDDLALLPPNATPASAPSSRLLDLLSTGGLSGSLPSLPGSLPGLPLAPTAGVTQPGAGSDAKHDSSPSKKIRTSDDEVAEGEPAPQHTSQPAREDACRQLAYEAPRGASNQPGATSSHAATPSSGLATGFFQTGLPFPSLRRVYPPHPDKQPHATPCSLNASGASTRLTPPLQAAAAPFVTHLPGPAAQPAEPVFRMRGGRRRAAAADAGTSAGQQEAAATAGVRASAARSILALSVDKGSDVADKENCVRGVMRAGETGGVGKALARDRLGR